jgi:hypothetical protein
MTILFKEFLESSFTILFLECLKNDTSFADKVSCEAKRLFPGRSAKLTPFAIQLPHKAGFAHGIT